MHLCHWHKPCPVAIPVEGAELHLDELVGRWDNNVDDLSGFRTMVWGHRFEFDANGMGRRISWGGPGDRTLEFEWTRMDSKCICVWMQDEEVQDLWEYFHYQLSPHQGPYSHYVKLEPLPNSNEWMVFEPIYRLASEH